MPKYCHCTSNRNKILQRFLIYCFLGSAGEQVCRGDREPGGAEPRVRQGPGAQAPLQRTEQHLHRQVKSAKCGFFRH